MRSRFFRKNLPGWQPLFWLMLGLVLWAPVQWAEWQRGNVQAQWWNLFATAGWLLLLWVAAQRAQREWLRTLWTGVLLVSIFLRVLHAGLVHFSGQGFTVDVFLHLEWRSLQLALAQYGLPIAVLFAGLGLLAMWARRILRVGSSGPRRGALMAVVPGLALLMLARGGLPEYQLLRAAQHALAYRADGGAVAALAAGRLAESESGAEGKGRRTRTGRAKESHPALPRIRRTCPV